MYQTFASYDQNYVFVARLFAQYFQRGKRRWRGGVGRGTDLLNPLIGSIHALIENSGKNIPNIDEGQ